jgi:large subunit ribosomal protein L25
MEPVVISVSEREFSDCVAGVGGRNHIMSVNGGGSLNGQHVIVADMLVDPIKGTPRHVDLHRVSLTDKVKVHVPVQLVGTAAGAKAGGMVDFAMHEIEVECLPVHIPANIKVDVTALTIGHSIHLGDVTVPVGLKFHGDPKAAVVSILGRKGAEE